MTRTEAIVFKMPFGQYRGKTLGEINADDPDYLDWLEEEIDYEKHPKLAEALAILSVRRPDDI